MFPSPRVPRVRRSSLFLAVVVAALAFPLGVLANHQFADVPAAASYHDDVEALVDAGITSGCGGGNYCPTNPVTRGQMAQFLNRLGSLDGSTAPSVNAYTAQYADSTDGWSLGCPSNTALSGGLCFDTTTRSTGTVFAAAEFCANLGGGLFGRGQIWRLPAVLELRSADENGDITVAAEEWSSSLYYDDTNGAQAASFNGSATADNNTLDELPFRCAAIPQQIDSLVIIPFEEPQDGSDAGDVTSAPAVNENGTTE